MVYDVTYFVSLSRVPLGVALGSPLGLSFHPTAVAHLLCCSQHRGVCPNSTLFPPIPPRSACPPSNSPRARAVGLFVQLYSIRARRLRGIVRIAVARAIPVHAPCLSSRGSGAGCPTGRMPSRRHARTRGC